MRILSFLLLYLLVQNNLFGQEIDTVKNYGFARYPETVPTYPGCDSLKFNRELKKCFSNKIQALVSKNFDINKSIRNSLKLPKGRYRIINSFQIDTVGNIVNITIDAPDPKLEVEAYRVIKLIPKMCKPATQRNKKVIIPYTFPIVFLIDK